MGLFKKFSSYFQYCLAQFSPLIAFYDIHWMNRGVYTPQSPHGEKKGFILILWYLRNHWVLFQNYNINLTFIIVISMSLHSHLNLVLFCKILNRTLLRNILLASNLGKYFSVWSKYRTKYKKLKAFSRARH